MGVNDLESVRPDLAEQWHPTKNDSLTPSEVIAGSAKHFWWVCALGHEWSASAHNRNGGSGCPYCAGKKVLVGFNDLLTTNPNVAGEWHPARNGVISPEHVTAGSNKEFWWRCASGHDWQSNVNNRAKGSGCPYCSGKRSEQGHTDMMTTHPDLAREWHPTKNGALKPSDVLAGTGKRIWWLCAQGHEWSALGATRVRGAGCPFCSGRFAISGKTDLLTTNPELANEWHPTKNAGIAPHEVKRGSNVKVWWVCALGHEWLSPCSDRTAGKGCPFCSNSKVLPGFNDLATTHPELAKEWHVAKNGRLSPRSVIAGTNKKIWWLCWSGHSWQAAGNTRLRGNGCPYCSGALVLEGFNDLLTTHPDLAKEWHPTKNGSLDPAKVAAGSNVKVWWRCLLGHDWEAPCWGRKGGLRGCPYCANKKVWVGFNDLATTNPTLAKEWHPIKNGDATPTDVMAGINKKVWWQCALGHEWFVSGNSRAYGAACPYCSNLKAWPGFNDLATTNPNLAREWHRTKNGTMRPDQVLAGSALKVWWQCRDDHEWRSTLAHRSNGRGCPRCAKSGYDQSSPGYLYLLRKEDLGIQQFGITNFPEDRLLNHKRNGWELLDVVGPADGVWIRETETALGRYFRSMGRLLPRDYPDKFDGYSESWYPQGLEFTRCSDLLEALRDWER